VIYLDEVANRIVAEQAALHPTGYLFQTERGYPYIERGDSRNNPLRDAWRRLLERPAVQHHLFEHGIDRRDLVPYGFRHTYITGMLAAGQPADVVAELVGTSISQIEGHYGHLVRETAVLRKAVDDYAAWGGK
jgi:integrase